MKLLTSFLLLFLSVSAWSIPALKYLEPTHHPFWVNKKVRNVFTRAGSYYWSDPSVNFMSDYGLVPGDTVVITKDLAIDHIEIRNISGIIFVNEGGLATIGSFNLYPPARDVKILGNGHPGIERGILMRGANFGINWEAVGNLEIGWVEINGNPMGIKVSHIPTGIFPLNTVNLYIHHCKVTNIGQEGMYLGRDELGGPFITGKLFQNQVSTTGRDGIQVRNGYYEVTYCSISDVGRNREPDHDDGLLFGGNTKGGLAKWNYIATNIRGNAIFCNGAGDFLFESNTMQSDAPAFFSKSPIASEDKQGVGYQTITAKGNTLSSLSGIAYQAYKQNDYPLKINWCGNATTGRLDIMQGITIDTTCSSPAPPPQVVVSIRNDNVIVLNPFIIIQTAVAGLKYEVYSVSSTPKLLFSGLTNSGETKVNISKVTNKYFTVKVGSQTFRVNR